MAIKRFKSLPDRRAKDAQELPGEPDYKFKWAKSPVTYIGEENINAVLDLLNKWIKDARAGNFCRPPHCALLPSLVDFEKPVNPQLSIVIYNQMLQQYSCNTEEKWAATAEDLLAYLELAAQSLVSFYRIATIEELRKWTVEPHKRPPMSCPKRYMKRHQYLRAGDILHFIVSQSDKLDVFHGTNFPQETMMKIVVDFNAYYKQEPVPSFVLVEDLNHPHPPGYYHEELFEEVTADQLDLSSSYESRHATKSGAALGYIAGLDRDRAQKPAKSCLVQPPGNKFGSAKKQTKRLRFTSPQEYYRQPTFEPPVTEPYVESPQPPPPPPKVIKRKPTRKIDTEREMKRMRLFSPFKAVTSEPPAEKADLVTDKAGNQEENVVEETTNREEAAVEETDDHEGIAGLPQELALRLAFSDDEGADQLRLKISVTKQEELRVVRQRRAEAEEAERLRLAEEEEERLRKEEAERRLSGGLRPPKRPVITDITDEWRRRVLGTLNAQPNVELAKSPEGSALRSNDFRTVIPEHEWLNDEVVNGALIHLANYVNRKAGIEDPKKQTPKCHAFTSFFWTRLAEKGPADMQRWIRRAGINKDNFDNVDTILMPICKGNHWTLVVVRPQLRTIAHMDSLKLRGQTTVIDITLKLVQTILQDRWTEEWKVVGYNAPLQTNGWDCGVNTVTNAMFVSLGLDPAYYTSPEMPLQRLRIAATLLNGGFSREFDLEGI